MVKLRESLFPSTSCSIIIFHLHQELEKFRRLVAFWSQWFNKTQFWGVQAGYKSNMLDGTRSVWSGARMTKVQKGLLYSYSSNKLMKDYIILSCKWHLALEGWHLEEDKLRAGSCDTVSVKKRGWKVGRKIIKMMKGEWDKDEVERTRLK